MKPDDLGFALGPIKIGTTGNMVKRFAALSAASPYPLELIGYYEDESAEQEERALHSLLADHRVRYEWFHATDEVLLVIAERSHRFIPHRIKDKHSGRIGSAMRVHFASELQRVSA